MACIDLTLMAELVAATLVVATLDPAVPVSSPPPINPTPAELPPDASQAGWSPQRDRHAQRILHLEARRLH